MRAAVLSSLLVITSTLPQTLAQAPRLPQAPMKTKASEHPRAREVPSVQERERQKEKQVAPASEALTLDVMTFNVRYGTARDGEDSWEKRRDMVLGLLRDQHPDVLGLQEALDFQVREIAAALPHHRVLGQGREGGTKGEYAALLVNAERFDVVEHGDFWLSDTPDQVASKGWDAALPRMCTQAVLQAKSGAPRFTVLNTHFDHVGLRARDESARLIVQRLRALGPQPTLVLGDLNTGEGSSPLATLHAAGFRDSFRVAHAAAGEAGTFHAFRGDRTGAKIDYVLCDAHWQVLEAAIVHTAREGRYPSDHFPVTARLQLLAAPTSATPPASGSEEPPAGGGGKLPRR